MPFETVNPSALEKSPKIVGNYIPSPEEAATLRDQEIADLETKIHTLEVRLNEIAHMFPLWKLVATPEGHIIAEKLVRLHKEHTRLKGLRDTPQLH